MNKEELRNLKDRPLTCLELQKYMASQPDDKPILFSYGGRLLKLYECWAEKEAYIIQLEDELPVIERNS